ncbi:MAG: STAS domain-containing protein [Planctomycetota bacterium]|jgi:anti-sigma B factor antagonist
MTPEELEVITENVEDGVIFRPVGEMDLTRAPALRAQLAQVLHQHPGRLIVDLRDVSYMDSPGVATLVEALRMARRRSCLLVVCGLQPLVRSVFEISRVHENVFTVVETVEEALELTNRRATPRVTPQFLRSDLGEILDLSISGVRVRSRRRLTGRQPVRLWRDGVDLDLNGEVMWSRRLGLFAHEIGLRFIEPAASALEVLGGLVQEALSEEDRRTLGAPGPGTVA